MTHAIGALVPRAVLVFCFTLSACGGSTEAAVDVTPRASELLISTAPFSPYCPQPGKVLTPGPGVLVTDQYTRPVPFIEVTFRADDGEQLSHSLAFTDAHGVATTGSWRLSDVQGSHTLIASVVGGPSVTIRIATEAGSRVTGAFDLVSFGSRPLPDTSHTGNVLTAGHLFFAENRTSHVTHEWDGHVEALPEVLCYGAPYVVGLSQIDFYWPAAPADTTVMPHGQHFATATIRGDTLSITYDDGDFDDEVYVRRSGATPLGGR